MNTRRTGHGHRLTHRRGSIAVQQRRPGHRRGPAHSSHTRAGGSHPHRRKR